MLRFGAAIQTFEVMLQIHDNATRRDLTTRKAVLKYRKFRRISSLCFSPCGIFRIYDL